MENKNMRKLNVTVQCMAVYNSSIMVPRELTFEEAIKYAKEHIDEINLGGFTTQDIVEIRSCPLCGKRFVKG